MTMFKKIQTPWTIRLVSVKKPNTLNYPILVGYFGDLAKFSRILEIFVKKLINNYTFDKSKHLELSDYILGHSQIFSDTI